MYPRLLHLQNGPIYSTCSIGCDKVGALRKYWLLLLIVHVISKDVESNRKDEIGSY